MTRSFKRLLPVLAGGVLMAAGAWAQAAQSASASGEVRRVDASSGKVTIKHGPISALDLPAMTLVYQAAPNLLTGIKPGDKVNFTATRDKENYVVTQINK
mgnify:CR=1 FL=1